MKINLSEIPTLYIQLGLSLFVGIIYLIVKPFAYRLLDAHAVKHHLKGRREQYVKKAVKIFLSLIALVFICIIWDITFQGLSIYFASIFTIIGVAFFAQWSILSNITASLILFFYYTYKLGSKIQVMDGANSIEGTIKNINLFYIEIETEEGELVAYPNSLALQKPIMKYK